MTVVRNMSMMEYRDLCAVSSSDLKNLRRSPAYAFLRPEKKSEAKEFGTAVHTAILEPATLSNRYQLDPESPKGGYPAGWRNTTDYKTQLAEIRGSNKALLTQTEFDSLNQITENIKSHSIGKQLYELAGERESSILTNEANTGLAVKVRPDWWIPSARTVLDVKSTADHRPDPFSRDCAKFGYHISQAFYTDVMWIEGLEVENYLHLVVNSDPPHEVAVYALDRDSVEQGRFEYLKLLAQWAECKRTGIWSGGSGEIEELRLPHYAITYFEDQNVR